MIVKGAAAARRRLRDRAVRAPALLLAALLICGVAAADAPGVTHYVLDPARSSLEFTFLQAGAQNKGRFRSLQVSFDFSPDNLAASHLDVVVEINSLDSGDQERDDTLRSADLLAVSKFPQAHFAAAQINRSAAGYEAIGKLTIRGVTRDARIPFTFRTASENGAPVGYMSGKTSVRRLDYGVGQGDWKATDQVGNEVGIAFALRLSAH
ncbi:MAG TPA: YceI family protein [Steroidobacteraceae bacterium]|jgi:polyisoprenoid-binding protein YceI|nr:YceI family protein [Steroidobacteraceae bacterium]